MESPGPFDDARIAVIGAGCGGLRTALAVRRRLPRTTLVVFDPRTTFPRDRTWCRWSFGPDETDEIVDRRWTCWRVRSPGRDVVAGDAAHPYCHVASDRFHAWAFDRLDDARTERRLGATVDAVAERADDVEVRWHEAGGTPRAEAFDLVLDGRPPVRAPGPGGLVQHFVGLELAFDRDVLDPEVVTLMDFDVPQSDGLHFVYVLPYDARRGLVESTFMTPATAAAPDHEAHVRAWVDRHAGGADATVLRREAGRLPMTTERLGPASSARRWTIGGGAGIPRASTGYAFDAIGRDAVRVADALARGRPRPAPPRSALLEQLDRCFVSLLAARPELGPRVFTDLFGRVETPALLRFLGDRATLADVFAVVRAVPAMPMLRHLAASPGLLRPGRPR